MNQKQKPKRTKPIRFQNTEKVEIKRGPTKYHLKLAQFSDKFLGGKCAAFDLFCFALSIDIFINAIYLISYSFII